MRYIVLFALSLLCLMSCEKKSHTSSIDLPEISARDTIKVATMYGSSSYFNFKGEEMGFDYDLFKRFISEQKMEFDLIVVNSQSEMIEMLKHEKVDLIAYRLGISNALKEEIAFIENEFITNQVLVQRSSKEGLSNVIDLIGKEIYVNKGTKYEERLTNLNAELGGGILVRTVDDSLTVDDLIEMVSLGKIDYTIAENDVALLNKTYFRNIDCKLPVSFNQRTAWAVRKSSPILLDTLNHFFKSSIERKYYKSLHNKYFTKAKYFDDRGIKIQKGAISPYDSLFRKNASTIGWDWQLLAAIAFEESRFDTSAVSWVGARGLMQLMPKTGEIYGLNDTTITNPALNIEAATKYLSTLNSMFRSIEDKDERLKFILASYNGGQAHVIDARALAEKYGKDKSVWYGNVEEYLLLKGLPEYYNDPVAKYGYFRGNQTVRYVNDVLRTFEKYKQRQ